MCRIFCSPDKELFFKEEDLWEYFYRLEKSLGKDGNGIYNFTTKELWKNHERMPTEANLEGGILFHTRYATNGLVKTYNCQPFDNEKYVMVHNGSFSAIDTYARLLGFQFSSKKYSDTYIMAWVMEKVGIFAFYNTFKDKFYGVILAYDKKTDKLYLLKTGGSFEYGIFEDGAHIYGSASIDFWGIKDKAISFKNGLYMISEKGFTQIHIPTEITTYSSQQTDYYGNSYKKSGYGYQSDYYGLKGRKRQKKINKKINKLKKKIVDKKDDDEDNDYVGISILFKQIIPKECHGCNWVYKRHCWFGGTEHEHPVNVVHPDTNKLLCNTKTGNADVIINCSECNGKLSNEIDWGIFEEKIMCSECELDTLYYSKECRDCEHLDQPSTAEPCFSCYNDNAVPRNWTEIKSNTICAGCYFEREASENGYPCRVCEEKADGMTRWTSEKNISNDDDEVCSNCNGKFDQWDGKEKDSHGNVMCWECLHEARNDEDNDDYWKEFYEMDYYKNGKWRYG